MASPPFTFFLRPVSLCLKSEPKEHMETCPCLVNDKHVGCITFQLKDQEGCGPPLRLAKT
jgi:hypothetical protein